MRFGFSLGLAHPRGAAVAAADPFAALYGTGMGQMPMDISPQDAVLDGNGNVVSIANRGGAGALLNATASGVVGVQNGRFHLPNATTGYLRLATDANLMGARLFFVAAVASQSASSLPRLAGRNDAGTKTVLRISVATGGILAQRIAASAFVGGVGGVEALRLYEIELVTGRLSVWVDGAFSGQAALDAAWTDYPVNLLFTAAELTEHFRGQVGRVQIVITDGTPARDATMLTVRQGLAAQHGITLA